MKIAYYGVQEKPKILKTVNGKKRTTLFAQKNLEMILIEH